MKNRLLNKGFTLVEILIAVIILAVGILAVSQMTVMGMQTSSVINRQMYAREVLGRYYESLHGLPTSDTAYFKHRTSVNLDDTTINCDYIQTENSPAGNYTVIWNIMDNAPDPRFKTVRIHILQPPFRLHLKSDIIKRY